MTFRRIAHALLAAGMVLALNSPSASAQTSYANTRATSMLSVGLGFAGGTSMTIDPATNWRVAPVFAHRLGLDVTYPVSSIVGVTMQLGIDSRGAEYTWFEDKSLWEARRINYFSITPGIKLSSFFLGVNLGFPMGGNKSWQDGSEAGERHLELDATKDSLLMMIEPRVGAIIPLVDEEIGWLGLTLSGGYNFNNLSEKTDFIPGTTSATSNGSNTVSLHLGLTWQFGIPGTGR